jgi:hypothetical protein
MLVWIGMAVVAWTGVFCWRMDRFLHPVRNWEDTLQLYLRMDRSNPPPANAVLFVGSSSVRLWESIRRDFPNYRVFRRGLNGARLPDTRRHSTGLILPYAPSMVILYGGDNDLADGHPPSEVLREYQRLVGRVQRELPAVRVGILAIKPSPSRWNLRKHIRQLNAHLQDWCRQDDRLVFIDVHSGMLDSDGHPRPVFFEADGLHLSHTGYAHWAEIIRPHLPEAARVTNVMGFAAAPVP